MKRVFLIVLDSCGIGRMPDSELFGDFDCNTLKRISQSKNFSAKNLIKLGLGNIDSVSYLPFVSEPAAAVARLGELSNGKDTTIGHWEIAGIISEKPFPVYPNGFPKDILDRFSELTGRGVLCNAPYSGTDVIRDFGEQHLRTGDLIIYTSADSVFQIAAHESLVSPEQLYEYCKIARRLLCGEHAVGRVIARPFAGEAPNFYRTSNRKDFSIKPPKNTVLDLISKSGKSVISVGKISDIFAGQGITEAFATHSNEEGIEITKELMQREFDGLAFINLVDFDMLYGHRQDIDGYALALSKFDDELDQIISQLQPEDVLIITADHGCDPGDNSTDHTREYVPLIVFGDAVRPLNLGTRNCFADIGATIADILGLEWNGAGTSFWDRIKREGN